MILFTPQVRQNSAAAEKTVLQRGHVAAGPGFELLRCEDPLDLERLLDPRPCSSPFGISTSSGPSGAPAPVPACCSHSRP